jgi:hypothetical protein
VTLLITHIQQTQTSIIPDSIIPTPKTPKPKVPKSKFPTPNHPNANMPTFSDRHASREKKYFYFIELPAIQYIYESNVSNVSDFANNKYRKNALFFSIHFIFTFLAIHSISF